MKGKRTILGNNQSWQSWLHNCKEAWTTEGVNCSMYAKDCHNALVAVEKKPGDSRVKIAAKAWALHQEWKKQGKW